MKTNRIKREERDPRARALPLSVQGIRRGQEKERLSCRTDRLWRDTRRRPGGPLGPDCESSNPSEADLFLNQFLLCHHTTQLAAFAHSGGGAHTSFILLFVLPVLAMCAVSVPLPEKLFDSDFVRGLEAFSPSTSRLLT